MTFSLTTRLLGACALALAVANPVLRAQIASQPAPTAATPAAPTDAFGRSSPRGTVRGFLGAARKGDNALASHYLDTHLSGKAAEELAHQLFIVLDAKLPAGLAQVSDRPEGSRSNPLEPDHEIVGGIPGPAGTVTVSLARVTRPHETPIWLFSRETLAAIPDLHAELMRQRRGPVLPRFIADRRVMGVRLGEWLALLVGLPLFYLATVLLNRALHPLMAAWWRRSFKRPALPPPNVLPTPARLLLLAFASRWVLSHLPFSLVVREFLSNAATLLALAAAAWLLIRIGGEIEHHLRQRLPAANYPAAVSLLRAGRRVVDLLVLLAALLAILRHFGVDPTPILAGLGVGGIAVALAAQKTLENVIAGASLIFDQAVRVGDYLKLGEIEGTVDYIGLRSTRIRTLGRTIVSVPNSQVANMSLETLSARDKFWFHPIVGLRYETTADQLRAVLTGVRSMLTTHPAIEQSSVRVRLLRLGTFSLDVEVFAYVFARDWAHYLEIQEQLLLTVTEIVECAGTAIAFPSQTTYLASQAPSALQPVQTVNHKGH